MVKFIYVGNEEGSYEFVATDEKRMGTYRYSSAFARVAPWTLRACLSIWILLQCCQFPCCYQEDEVVMGIDGSQVAVARSRGAKIARNDYVNESKEQQAYDGECRIASW